jgi:autotransporter-associated beta strand protein
MHASSATPRLLAALLALSAAGSSAFAADFYWGQTTYSSGSIYTGDFATAGNWFTTAAGTTGAGAAPSSLTDDAFFNTTAANSTGGTVTVNASISARSLTFNTSGATTLSQSGNQNLILGTGGITLGASSGVVSLGTSTNTLSVRVAADQTWTNNSASTLTVRALNTSSGSGGGQLTINAASTGGISYSLNIGDSSSTDQLALVIDSTGTGLVTLNGTANTYRGGTTIKRGALSTFGTLGSGAVLLGDTTGSAAATLNVRATIANGFSNNITVQAGSSGIKTLTTNQTGGVALGGTLTLNDNLTFTASTDGTFNGAISGTGNFVKGGNGALTFASANTSSGNLTLNTGAFTLTEATGALTFYIGANGVTNQVNGTTTGAVAFNGTFNLNLDSATLANGNSWTLVALASTAESYGGTFSLTGFTENNNVWTNGAGLSFSEATGILSYSAVPEPSTFALLGGLTTLLFASARRRRTRA